MQILKYVLDNFSEPTLKRRKIPINMTLCELIVTFELMHMYAPITQHEVHIVANMRYIKRGISLSFTIERNFIIDVLVVQYYSL